MDAGAGTWLERELGQLPPGRAGPRERRGGLLGLAASDSFPRALILKAYSLGESLSPQGAWLRKSLVRLLLSALVP